jgi:hypothetical protein
VNGLADNERMRRPATRTRPRTRTYVKIEPTQHWRRIGDAWGRDWIARCVETGELCRATYLDKATA